MVSRRRRSARATAAEWERLTPEARARVVASLPAEVPIELHRPRATGTACRSIGRATRSTVEGLDAAAEIAVGGYHA